MFTLSSLLASQKPGVRVPVSPSMSGESETLPGDQITRHDRRIREKYPRLSIFCDMLCVPGIGVRCGGITAVESSDTEIQLTSERPRDALGAGEFVH